jgi:hypothetical protein
MREKYLKKASPTTYAFNNKKFIYSKAAFAAFSYIKTDNVNYSLPIPSSSNKENDPTSSGYLS